MVSYPTTRRKSFYETERKSRDRFRWLLRYWGPLLADCSLVKKRPDHRRRYQCRSGVAVASAINEAGGQATFVHLDVSDESAWLEAVPPPYRPMAVSIYG
ncbi:MAG: hypothetical protein CM1200mP41_05040 [Gammaproteobacteria bacterium]|nr:MAG: hypothetical protein CM1200mP41_05040 [Gammaproteobacteria bacterium]